jgi:hypothetical protein
MRYSGVVLCALLLCSCATTPSPNACFQDASDAVGWKPIHNPPYHADEMRKLAHQNGVSNQLPHRPEYWFSYFDGRVMLCEPVKQRNCGATIRIRRNGDIQSWSRAYVCLGPVAIRITIGSSESQGASAVSHRGRSMIGIKCLRFAVTQPRVAQPGTSVPPRDGEVPYIR